MVGIPYIHFAAKPELYSAINGIILGTGSTCFRTKFVNPLTF